MSDAILAEEIKSPTKKAFVSKPYTQEERRERDEKELEELIKEQQGETKETSEEEKIDAEEPKNAEEKTFKKRYSDLRRHQQKQAEEFKTEIENIKRQLSEATKKAKEQSLALEDRLKAIDEMHMSASKEKAEVELMKLHPDFDDIRDSDSFHEWADDQPKWVKDALYDNETDARSAGRAIDLYKADMGISAKKPKTSKDAAKSVDTKTSRSKPQEDATASYLKESTVQKMSAMEYEKQSDAIMEAIRSGKFIYDVSGSAR